MRGKLPIVGLLLLSAVFPGCSGDAKSSASWRRAKIQVQEQEWRYTNGMAWPKSPGDSETVMRVGMKITAIGDTDQISIEGMEGYRRRYTWDGASRSATLWARKSRWYGSLGIYFPGPGQHWKSNGGITRGVLNEGILWFGSLQSARDWISNVQPLENCEYTSTGLLIAWQKVPARKQINVDVWQIMVAGEKPTALPGAHDDRVTIEQSR